MSSNKTNTSRPVKKRIFICKSLQVNMNNLRSPRSSTMTCKSVVMMHFTFGLNFYDSRAKHNIVREHSDSLCFTLQRTSPMTLQARRKYQLEFP